MSAVHLVAAPEQVLQQKSFAEPHMPPVLMAAHEANAPFVSFLTSASVLSAVHLSAPQVLQQNFSAPLPQ